MSACVVERCQKPVTYKRNGWCHTHYEQWRRSGGTIEPYPVDNLGRFMRMVVNHSNGCWHWTGAITEGPGRGAGYGQFRLNGRHRQAHRAAYELMVGPIPEDMQIDHMCHDASVCVGPCLHRRCVNPDHLKAVPAVTNLMRSSAPSAINAVKTHCIRGHALSGANLIVEKSGKRQCRVCTVLRRKRYRRRVVA